MDGLSNLKALWRSEFGRDLPGKVVCVGRNYVEHAEERGADVPVEPMLFAKFANAVVGDGDPIVLPLESSHVDAEAELAVAIGRGGRRVSPDDALELVRGYLCGNDVGARDLQARDGQWLRAKGFDSFCPLGPRLVPVSELGDAGDLRVVQRLNGEVLQDGRTSAMVFGVRALVAHASSCLTLEPGDVVLTGTPAGVGVHRDPPVALADGDVVEVEVEGIGVLRNPVVREARRGG